jgi:hypothetical protein
VFDAVLANTRLNAEHPPHWHSDVVASAWHDTHGLEVLTADVVDEHDAIRHDPAKLAGAIVRAWARHTPNGRRGEPAERAHPRIA